MNEWDLKKRTKALALRVIRFVEKLPRNRTFDVIGRQLIRSGTSVAANYRASCRAKSRKDFIAKMGIVEEEADETLFWLELVTEIGLANLKQEIEELTDEANQIVSIVVTSIKTARKTK